MAKNKKNRTNRDWMSIIDGLSLNGTVTKIRMGSAGSAQVTRCRLLSAYEGIIVASTGNVLEISLG